MLSINPLNVNNKTNSSGKVTFDGMRGRGNLRHFNVRIRDSFVKRTAGSVVETPIVERPPEQIKKMTMNSLRINSENLQKEYSENMLYLNGGYPENYGDMGEKYKESLFKKLTVATVARDQSKIAELLKKHAKKNESEKVEGLYSKLAKLIAEQDSGSTRPELKEDIADLIAQKDRLQKRNNEIMSLMRKNSEEINEIKEQLKNFYYTIKE